MESAGNPTASPGSGRRWPWGSQTPRAAAMSGNDAQDGGRTFAETRRSAIPSSGIEAQAICEARASVRLPGGRRGGRRCPRGAPGRRTSRGAATRRRPSGRAWGSGRRSGRSAAARPGSAGRDARRGPTGRTGRRAPARAASAPRPSPGSRPPAWPYGCPTGSSTTPPYIARRTRMCAPAPPRATTPGLRPPTPARGPRRAPRGGVRWRSDRWSGRFAGSRPGTPAVTRIGRASMPLMSGLGRGPPRGPCDPDHVGGAPPGRQGAGLGRDKMQKCKEQNAENRFG